MKKISLALDGLSPERALELTRKLGRLLRAVKLHDLIDRWGSVVIQRLKATGVKRVWVDYKLHDTKDTVVLRVKALIENGADIITVHASGGVPMMKAAVDATFSEPREDIAEIGASTVTQMAEIYAITVLTSLDDEEIKRIYGKDRTRAQIVHELALMAHEAGVRTVVCSAQEVKMLKESVDLPGMRFTVPGTRSEGVALGQQKRSGTPGQATEDGADELVAGSQITKAEDPVAAFKSMASEIGETMDA